MAKTIVDPQMEQDKQTIMKLRRVTKPIHSEMEEIFSMYKKYVNPEASSYCSSCSAGPYNSIQRFYWAVIALDVDNLIKK